MSRIFFAHGAGTHIMKDGSSMSDLEHCAPILIGAGIIILVLFAIITYFLVAWQPKRPTKTAKKKVD